MELYNKLEIAAEIKEISDLKSGNKADYIFGKISSFNVKNGNRFNFLNLKIIAFGEKAQNLSKLDLQEGDIAVFNGLLQEQSYNNRKYFQLVVTNCQVKERVEQEQSYQREETYEPVVKKKKENPYRSSNTIFQNNNDEDDFPI